MKKELYVVAIVFATICFGISSFQHNLELKRVHKIIESEQNAKIEAMKLALELNKTNDSYIDMLASMNKYADELEYRLEVIEKQNQIIKDLRSSK